MKMTIEKQAEQMLTEFNWDVNELRNVPEVANANEVVITDAGLYCICMTIDGRACEIFVDGYIEWMED
jgi:hypothetical protein